MTSNITPSFVSDETLNSNLASMEEAKLQKYINRAASLIGSYVNLNQFKQEDWTYLFPDDLAGAFVYFIEYLFIDSGGMFTWWASQFKAEKIGDYWYTKQDKWTVEESIDAPKNIISILDRYATRWSSYGVKVGSLDRKYSE